MSEQKKASNIFEIFRRNKKQKILDIIESFSLSEKIFFYVFVIIFTGSSLYLLAKVNEVFSVEVPIDGGTLKEGLIGYPRYINPLVSVTDSSRDLSTIIYSGLLKPDNNGGLVNDLAKEYKISEDKLTYTFTLKEGISFHDGVPVTAEDIEFTIKKALDPIIKSPKAASFEGVSVKVISPNVIEFTLKEPYAPFLQNLTIGILPKHIWDKVDSEAFLFSQFNLEPIGSGPFKIKDIEKDKSGLPLSYHLIPFSNYAIKKPYINDLYIYFYTNEEALISAFQNGEITSINSISPENINRVKNTGKLIRNPLPRIFALFLNQNQANLFANKEVRDALNTVTDRKAIIDEVLSGYGTVAYGPLPVTNTKEISDTETLDTKIEKAKNILTKAGWALGEDGVMRKTSKKENLILSFSITTSNSPDLQKTAEVLKTNFEKIGAVVDIKVFDLVDLQQNTIKNRKYEALLFGEIVGRDMDIFSFWHSSERNSPGLNLSMYTNDKVDKLLKKIRTEDDSEERNADLNLVQDYIMADNPAIFLYSPDFIYIVPENLNGISLEKMTSASERFIGIENWYMKTEHVWPIFNK